MRENNSCLQTMDHERVYYNPSPKILRMQREIFYLWIFIAREELMDEASDFLDVHRDTPTPFEDFLVS